LNTKGKIYSINISEQKGVKKNPVDNARISSEGIEGDGHRGDWHRQVSLLSLESILSFNSQFKVETKPGEFGENITTSGIDLKLLKIGDRLIILKPDADFTDKSSVILEVTQIGKECLTPCRIFYEVGRCIMPAEGIFFKVIKTGEIKPGDNIIFL
jgi:cyclic pyranopterin phosphate synthase